MLEIDAPSVKGANQEMAVNRAVTFMGPHKMEVQEAIQATLDTEERGEIRCL